jgi:outer membrane protein, heavy metal efflux system
MPIPKRACALLASGLLYGCAQTPSFDGRAALNEQLQAHHPTLTLSPTDNPSTTLPLAAAQPLGLLDAWQLALLQAPAIQADLARLGLAQAQLDAAQRLSNPQVHWQALTEDGSQWQWELGISQPLLDLLTRPLRRQMAEAERLRTQWWLEKRLREQLAAISHQYFAAIAAAQRRQISQEHQALADARVELAQARTAAGNLSALALLDSQQQRLQGQERLLQDQADAEKQAWKLRRLLGLPLDAPLPLPSQLPKVQGPAPALAPLLESAPQQRLDLRLATQHQERLHQQLRLAEQKNRWGHAELGLALEQEPDAERLWGPSINLQLPLFDRGQSLRLRAQAQLERQTALTQDLQQRIALEVHQAHQRLALALAQQELAQAAEALEARRYQLLQREVNFMLQDPEALLTSQALRLKRQQDQLKQQLAFWQAACDLALASGSPLPAPSTAATGQQPPATPQADHQHHQDHGHSDHSQHPSPGHQAHPAPPTAPAPTASQPQEHRHESP